MGHSLARGSVLTPLLQPRQECCCAFAACVLAVRCATEISDIMLPLNPSDEYTAMARQRQQPSQQSQSFPNYESMDMDVDSEHAAPVPATKRSHLGTFE